MIIVARSVHVYLIEILLGWKCHILPTEKSQQFGKCIYLNQVPKTKIVMNKMEGSSLTTKKEKLKKLTKIF